MAKTRCRFLKGQNPQKKVIFSRRSGTLRIGLYNKMGRAERGLEIHMLLDRRIDEVQKTECEQLVCFCDAGVACLIRTIVDDHLKTVQMKDPFFATGKNQGLNIQAIRDEFPMLKTEINGKPLIYLDSAATSHKPKRVLDRLYQFYTEEYAKPKEAHTLSQHATELMEESRKKMARFLNARSEKEVVFNRGCTEGINMVAGGFERGLLKKGDEILITALEHHANIVPWQMACEQTGAVLKVVPITASGEIDLNRYEEAISAKTKVVAFAHSSHVLGTLLPAKEMIALAHKRDIPVMVDGAQTAPHMPVDMQELDCDFYTFSGHKMGMPSGVGVLYGKEEWLEKLPPYEGGGDMTEEVSFEKPVYSKGYLKFEAGTMPFAEIIGLGTLLDFLWELDLSKTCAYEIELMKYAITVLSSIDRVKIYGTASEREPLVSFDVERLDVKKLERFLNDEYNLDVRAGDLTAQPLMKILGVKALLRASFCYYNTTNEIDILAGAVEEFIKKNR
jgi:cysteine desulfurase/selenocysteine lyase